MFFGFFDFVFPIMFCLVFVLILLSFARGLKEWNRNNHSPALDVEATVVAKRTNTSISGVGETSSASTSYYVTFQFNSGDRMELRVPGQEFGLMTEGDHGILAFQGTRFLKFVRT